MNERIRELMWDAGLNSNYVEGFDSIYSKQLEKFAELIVKECVQVATEQGNSAEYSFTAIRAKWFRLGALKSATMIKRTFGVE